MKNKTKITEDNYKEIVLKRAIIICWVLLAICFVIKLFGSNFFAIVCTNKKVISVCNFVDKTAIKHILHFIMFLMSSYMLIYTVKPNFIIKSKNNLFCFIYLFLVWLCKEIIELKLISLPILIIDIMDFVLLFILLFIQCKKIWKSLLGVVLLFVFTLISTIVKSIGMGDVLTESYLIINIFLIDYYIMLLLTALYSKQIFNRR